MQHRTQKNNKQKTKSVSPSQQDVITAVKNNPEILSHPELQPMVQIFQKSHSGPLPAPEDIEHYNRIIPDGADRIMKMAEKSLDISDRGQDANINFQKEDFAIQKRGQILGFLSILIFSGLAGYLAYLGNPGSAAALMGTGLVAIVGAFVYGRSQQQQGK